MQSEPQTEKENDTMFQGKCSGYHNTKVQSSMVYGKVLKESSITASQAWSEQFSPQVFKELIETGKILFTLNQQKKSFLH